MDIQYILDNTAGNLYWKDLDGRYQGANKAFINVMTQQVSGVFLGKTDREIFSSVMAPDKLNIIEETDQRIMKTGVEECIREEGVDEHGNIAFYYTKKMPLKDENDNIIGVMGTSLDITAEVASEARAKRYEALALKAEAKADTEEEMRKTVMVLVGDIVHDLRTPIATIRIANELLERFLPTAIKIIQDAKENKFQTAFDIKSRQLKPFEKNGITNSIKQAIQTMDDFINTSLLDLANAQKSLEERMTPDDLVKCSSRRILENTLEAYAFDENIQIHQQTTYDFFLMGNSILIMRILFNLIRNASEQIILKNKGEIFISTESYKNTNVIKIKDTAGGVRKDIEPKLFKDYFTTKKNGTGIGLAYSKRVMESFGGALTFNNKPNESIEFVLSFPKVN